MNLKLLSKVEFLRDAKSLNMLDNVIEHLSNVHRMAVENGLGSSRLSFTPWRIAKYRPAVRRLYLRIWGSPENVPALAETAIVAVETRLKSDIPHVPTEVKKALAGTIVELSITNRELRNRLVESIVGGDEEADILRSGLLEASKDMKLNDVVTLARESGKTINPKESLVSKIKAKSPRAARYYSELAKLQLSAMFDKIPATQVRKPEFATVLAEQGKVDYYELRSVYSLLMALILREPSQQLSYYHRRREEIRQDFVTPQATALELRHLIDLGYVNRVSHRYFPKNAKQLELNELFHAQ